MKKAIFITIVLLYSTLTFSQSIPITGDQYHLYGPNSTWGGNLKIGGNGRGTSNASVVSTNGNLHLDSKNGNALYLNHYSYGNTYINPRGGNVGIGTASPSSLLTLNSDSASVITLQQNNLTKSSIIGELDGASGGNLEFWTREDGGNNTQKMVIKSSGNVGIGITTPDAKLAVNGNIHTKEVKVDLIGWSDFVFGSDYNLPTLKEVEQHIKEKGHLRDIPSAEDVAKNGIYLGEMDSKLLQKIEELMLYTIKQEKEIETLKKQVSKTEELKNENIILKLLLKRVAKLEQQLNTIQK